MATVRSNSGSQSGLVLIIDDEPLMLRSLRRILQSDAHPCALAESPEGLDAHLADPALDVVLLDIVLGGTSGLDVLDHIKRERAEVEVIMMTGHASIQSAVGCMRRGAFDYLEKPFDDIHQVRTVVGRAIERRRLVRRERDLEDELLATSHWPGNVPERENSIESAVALSRGDLLRAADVQSVGGRSLSELRSASPEAQGLPLSLEAYERSALERALREERGDATAAARRLGIGRSTFYRKLAKRGLRVQSDVRTPSNGVGGVRSIR